MATPAEYFALIRLLLVPSVREEPFGRVAAEALINGIPALVSDRGALPDVIGGHLSDGGAGCVLPLPPWMTCQMTCQTTAVPTAAEVEGWLDAVCGRGCAGAVSTRRAAAGPLPPSSAIPRGCEHRRPSGSRAAGAGGT